MNLSTLNDQQIRMGIKLHSKSDIIHILGEIDGKAHKMNVLSDVNNQKIGKCNRRKSKENSDDLNYPSQAAGLDREGKSSGSRFNIMNSNIKLHPMLDKFPFIVNFKLSDNISCITIQLNFYK